MMKSNLGFFLTFVFFVFLSCKDTNHYIDKKSYQIVKSTCKVNSNLDMLIYYFDGDCSFCLAKVLAIENYIASNASKLEPVFIARTTNNGAMQFNLNNLKIKSPINIEKNNEFEKDLPFMKITRINTNRAVFDYDDKFNLNEK